jgi:hypothetical protein
MPNYSFTAQKADLDDACDFLRAFTLGQQGFTQRDGVAGIERVNKQCEQLTRLFASGPHGKQAATIVASARARVAAAQARMAILDKKK